MDGSVIGRSEELKEHRGLGDAGADDRGGVRDGSTVISTGGTESSCLAEILT
jgi:hypothetical protein